MTKIRFLVPAARRATAIVVAAALAWNRSGVAVVVCTAVVLRHLWPLHGAGQGVAFGATAVVATVWAGALMAFTTSGHDRLGLPWRQRTFALTTVGTVVLAVLALALAFYALP